MSHYPIHILHLTGQWLRWVKIQTGAAPRVIEKGTLDGAPENTLEQWADKVRDRRARIALYDGRPIYYSISMSVPSEALKQKERIIRLKMAQEIGLAEEQVFWTARIEPQKEAPDQSDVYLAVVRRDAMSDIVAWRARRRLTRLWVNPDLCAVRALLGHLAAPLVCVNNDSHGVTLYHANHQRQIIKERVDKHTPVRPDLGWNGATGRIHFGGEVPDGLYGRYPSLGVLPRSENGVLLQATGTSRLSAVSAEVLNLDAVLLGGILDHALGHPPTDDLIRVITPPAMEVILSKLTLARLGLVALLVAGGLGTVGSRVFKEAKAVRLGLEQQAQLLEPSVRQLQTQETILRRVKSDRKPIVPVFEAIHKAVPVGINLKTLSLGESGTVAMVGTCKNPDHPNEFTFGLNQSGLLDRVKLMEQKADPKTKIVSFRITGHVKGRGK